MTPTQQKEATKLLKYTLILKKKFDNGEAVDSETDDALTTDIRVFLIEIGALADRRKKKCGKN